MNDLFRPAKVGIVIGHYNALEFLELNLAAIRHHCGSVPVSVSDDRSRALGYEGERDGEAAIRDRLTKLCERHGVLLTINPKHLSHQEGDFAALRNGLRWAADNGLDSLCKLSQRCVIDTPNWAAACSEILFATEYSIFTDRYSAARMRIPSYGLIMRVHDWIALPDRLDTLPGFNVENKLWRFAAEKGLQIGHLSRKTLTLHHRLYSTPADYMRIAKAVGLQPPSEASYYTGARCHT